MGTGAGGGGGVWWAANDREVTKPGRENVGFTSWEETKPFKDIKGGSIL